MRHRRARGDLEVHRHLHSAARYADKADPGTTSFIPRPDWYFYFLFYLLRIFKWPATVILGTIGIPTICLVLLLALPFVDMRRERRLSRRPVALVAAVLVVLSMGVLTYKGATAKEAVASEASRPVPHVGEEGGLREQREAPSRARSSSPQTAASNCHTYNGAGASNLGAPDLSVDRRRRARASEFFRSLRLRPEQVRQPIAMPQFGERSTRSRSCRSPIFLDASKGPQVGAGAPCASSSA